jgi:D-glycero-D-manno-heptose 1,7-bisphosphate phosphatase
MGNKALFLDRDGTINVEKNYVYKIEDFEFREGIFNLVKAYFTQGYLIFVVTNQSGIARGFYSEEEYQLLTRWMVERFRDEGIEITKVYHCPHHPDITGPCRCRKPEPGMLLDAIREFSLDAAKCALIGDHERDLEAGRRAGIRNLYHINSKGRIDRPDDIIHKG